jgi:oligopeptide transport system substrate-binding protein
MRRIAVSSLILAVAACDRAADAPSASGATADAKAVSSTELPLQGPGLKNVDWASFFPAGDGWRNSEQTYVFNNGAEPKTLDPHKMTGVPEHRIAMAMFEGLVNMHPATLQPIPGCAEWWESNADGTVYTFHLRPKMTWSNGDPLTAADFVWSWQRALEPETLSQYADMFFAVEGAEDFNTGKTKDFGKVGVKALDPMTLQVTLHAPTAYFLELLAHETLMPLHRATVEKFGAEWTKPEHIVSNGPFTLATWRLRDAVELKKNPRYWNAGIVRLEKIVAKAIDDLDTSMNEFKTGGVDWIDTVPAKRVEEGQADPDYYATPYLGSYFYRINVTRKPMDDPRVRRALNLAINKTEVCEKVLKAGQIPAMGLVPPNMRGYTTLEGLAYDPKKARALLAEAGFPDGKDFPEVELLYNNNETHKTVAEVITSMWRETLGVRVRLAQREWQAYLEDQKNMNYQIARAAWIGDYCDPNTFLDMFVTGRGNNETGWSNKKYDDLLAAATRETDMKRRMDLLHQAEVILCAEDLPILPIYYYVNQGMLRSRVKGWHENLRDNHPYQFIYIDGPPAKSK